MSKWPQTHSTIKVGFEFITVNSLYPAMQCITKSHEHGNISLHSHSRTINDILIDCALLCNKEQHYRTKHRVIAIKADVHRCSKCSGILSSFV